MLDATELVPTSTDVGRHPEMAMAANRPEVVTSVNVGTRSIVSGMFENVGVAVGISPISHSVHELYLFPVYWPPLPFLGDGRRRSISEPVPLRRACPKIWV